MPLAEEAFKRVKAKHGPDHPTTLIVMGGLASCNLNAGMRVLGLPLAEDVLNRCRAKHGPEHPTPSVA